MRRTFAAFVLALTFAAQDVQLGHASDTSITRNTAAVTAVEGVPLIRGAASLPVIIFDDTYGADRAGGDNSTPLADSLDACAAAGGCHLVIPPGTYNFASGLGGKPVAVPLFIDFKLGACFEADSGVDVPLFHIVGAAGIARADARVVFNRPCIDMSAGDSSNPGGGTQPSAISVANYREVFVLYPDLYGGSAWSDGAQTALTTGGDSGVEAVNIYLLAVIGGRITGFIDAGVYASGGNDPGEADDGKWAVVQGVDISHTQYCIVGKRDLGWLIAQNNTISHCSIGVAAAEVPSPQDPDSPQRMDVFNNVIEYVVRPIHAQEQTKLRVAGNRIKDWGYDEDLSATVGSPSGIYLAGVSDCVVNNNTFLMEDLSDTKGHVGITVLDFTDAQSNRWDGGKCMGIGNTFLGVAHPFGEGW